jgi:hypothetical protein
MEMRKSRTKEVEFRHVCDCKICHRPILVMVRDGKEPEIAFTCRHYDGYGLWRYYDPLPTYIYSETSSVSSSPIINYTATSGYAAIDPDGLYNTISSGNVTVKKEF